MNSKAISLHQRKCLLSAVSFKMVKTIGNTVYGFYYFFERCSHSIGRRKTALLSSFWTVCCFIPLLIE